MTKTNAIAATKARAAKVQINDPHALTEEAKARKAASAAKQAKNPKASNQTAVADAPRKVQHGKPGKSKTEQLREMDRELAAEAARDGTVRARDQIVVNEDAPNGAAYRMVGVTDGQPLMIPKHKFVGALAEAAKLGSSFKAFRELWEAEKKASPGKLAQGLDGRNAPHSSKAVGDRAAAAKGTNKADKVQARKATEQAKKADRKANRAAKAAPKADDNRKITIVDKKFTYGKEGTSRNASWIACTKSKTVADYAKAGGALKYLGRWVSAGAIKLG